MSFWKLIKGIRFKQLTSLFRFPLKHPLFMFATIKATARTLKIVQEKFPDIHGKDNSANAFRHALWNYLIADKCMGNKNNTDVVISWAKEITDWHEDFSPNKGSARAMDLHNNNIGRELFKNHAGKQEKEVIAVLELELVNSVQVNSCEEIENYPTNLVFINHD